MKDKQKNGSRVAVRMEVCHHGTGDEYRFQIEFLVFQENDAYVAYCPALDISTSGKTFNEAVGNFCEMFQLHMECCIDAGTLQEDLLAHGWTVGKKNIAPPKFSSLVRKREVSRLLNSHFGFEKVVIPARITTCA